MFFKKNKQNMMQTLMNFMYGQVSELATKYNGPEQRAY